MLDIGAVDGRSVTQRRLIVMARGPNAKDMNFKVASVEPDFLKVTLGKTTVADATLTQTELMIEIPESKTLGNKAPANYLGGEKENSARSSWKRPVPRSFRCGFAFASRWQGEINQL